MNNKGIYELQQSPIFKFFAFFFIFWIDKLEIQII